MIGCTDDDECALDLHHCDPIHAECKNTNGSYDCQCKQGFEGDGFDCHVRLEYIYKIFSIHKFHLEPFSNQNRSTF